MPGSGDLVFLRQAWAAGMRANAPHGKINADIDKIVFFQLMVMEGLAKLSCSIRINGTGERLVRHDLKDPLHRQVLAAMVAAGFLGTDITPLIVFFSRGFVEAVVAGHMLVAVAFIRAKAYIRKAVISFIHSKFQAETGQLFYIVCDPVGNIRRQHIAFYSIFHFKGHRRLQAVDRHCAFKAAAGFRFVKIKDIGLAIA